MYGVPRAAVRLLRLESAAAVITLPIVEFVRQKSFSRPAQQVVLPGRQRDIAKTPQGAFYPMAGVIPKRPSRVPAVARPGITPAIG